MIISTILVWLGLWSSASSQPMIPAPNSQVVDPIFPPAGQRPASSVVPATQLFPANQVIQGKDPQKRTSGDDSGDIVIRTDLPGPQRLFSRESEAQFYERIRQEVKKVPGASPAIFPEEVPISKELYTQPMYPRLDPVTKLPFAHMTEVVEPSYVCHRRLLFEQPNFERAGWNLGAAQSAVQLGVFYYDLAMGPYHFCSDLKNRAECSTTKCLPGDPAPFTVPIERFSVTGIIGEMGAVLGGVYLFPH